jgi:hypothetical protein
MAGDGAEDINRPFRIAKRTPSEPVPYGVEMGLVLVY